MGESNYFTNLNALRCGTFIASVANNRKYFPTKRNKDLSDMAAKADRLGISYGQLSAMLYEPPKREPKKEIKVADDYEVDAGIDQTNSNQNYKRRILRKYGYRVTV